MLKKSITYKDFNDVEVTDVFYFNLSKSELIERELSATESLKDSIQRIIDSKMRSELMAEFKRLILSAYGEKSDDGKRFVKSEELREQFSQTAAYDELFVQLLTQDNAGIEFIQGIIPQDLESFAAKTTPQTIDEALSQQREMRLPTTSSTTSIMPPPPPGPYPSPISQ